jgi:ribosomal protein S18 acetylase RimI-like enzyme
MKTVIRIATHSDIPLMERDVKGSWGKPFEDDLKEQDAGIHSCFISVLDDCIVGSGFIRWHGPRDPEAFHLFPESPEIYRLAVLEEFQARGNGQALIAAMEDKARQKGFRSVSLGVGHENVRANNLYKRLGYQDTELVEYWDEYDYPTPDGKTATARDLCRYLVKSL